MATPLYEITVRCSTMDDALDIYCKAIAHKTQGRSEAILTLKSEGHEKVLTKDRLDRGERPQLNIVQ